jgi:hypothetical protein
VSSASRTNELLRAFGNSRTILSENRGDHDRLLPNNNKWETKHGGLDVPDTMRLKSREYENAKRVFDAGSRSEIDLLSQQPNGRRGRAGARIRRARKRR